MEQTLIALVLVLSPTDVAIVDIGTSMIGCEMAVMEYEVAEVSAYCAEIPNE